MTPSPNLLYKVFLSSTAIDLKDHRGKVRDAIHKMGDLPVAMEFFGAQPSAPVAVCQEKVRESDALCVLLAHRYGWVPSKEAGGDGHKSMTWIEVETALEAGKPVFAFLVDQKHPWDQPKEQDRLTQAKDEAEAAQIFKNVQALKEFRSFLEQTAGLTRATFTTPEDLATTVVTSLSTHIRKQQASGVSVGQIRKRPLEFREVHPLQPATHFCGRKEILQDFTAWWNDLLSPDRVRSLIAIGGTGKTALIQYFLANCIDKHNLKGSVLVWSFYENPNTDAFLAEALNVFAGETDREKGLGGRLPRLQRALAEGDQSHLIILDGLERVQSAGVGGHARGDLEDHRIKNLLRAIAAGRGKTRAIITSRFKITDLAQWEHRGYRGIALDTLDPEGAVALLRAWGVKGEDAQLAGLAKSLGHHALSVSVLGSYLKNYCGGDPAAATQFQLDDASMDDSQAAKLGRILAGYAENLSDDERDLLIRLSIFPKGVSIDILLYVIGAGGEIAGALVGAEQSKLLRLAKRLEILGLVYTYQLRNKITYTAHPFLREYFRQLSGVPPEEIHEVVRGQLAVGLDTKPENKPADTQILDRYEDLIEQTILAGQVQEACELYWNIMGGGGGGNHLYHTLSDYGRIIRIISLFSANGQPETLGLALSASDRSYLINAWGLAAGALGDLTLAKQSFVISDEIYRQEKNWYHLSAILQNRAWMAMFNGYFPEAQKLLEEAIKYADEGNKYLNTSNYSFLAATHHAMGEMLAAQENFMTATKIQKGPLYGPDGIFEAEHLFGLGQRKLAQERTESNFSKAETNGWSDNVSICHTLLGLFSLPSNTDKAREHLNQARQWTDQSGHMECTLRAYILAAEIALCEHDLDTAVSEATSGLQQAEMYGYGKFACDLMLQLARIHLTVPDPGTALTYARRALDWSSQPKVAYAWGVADGAELCGKCHQALGEHELAARRFAEAEVARQPLRL